jgi:excinuclease ABC subunit A
MPRSRPASGSRASVTRRNPVRVEVQPPEMLPNGVDARAKTAKPRSSTGGESGDQGAIGHRRTGETHRDRKADLGGTGTGGTSDRVIRVRGAKEHNLKNIDVELPRDRLVVITGLSGSGKSSLAFDTIFAEGQRKYMESLSAYARQFLEQLKKPDVEEIEGIPPTIAIEQRSASANPRSTVATTTEIYDYLRLLYARCGRPYSWAPTKVKKDGTVVERSGKPITATSSTQIVDAIMGWGEETERQGKAAKHEGGAAQGDAAQGSRHAARSPRHLTSTEHPALSTQHSGRTQDGLATPDSGLRLMVLAPVVRGKKGFHREVMEDLQKQGWQRARVNGRLVDLRDVLKEPGENPLGLGRYQKHTIEAVIDRIVLKPDVRQRLAESVEAALKLADGSVIVAREGSPMQAAEPRTQDPGSAPHAAPGWVDVSFSNRFADPDRPEYSLEELSPRLFSFNSPYGACPTCHGLGTLLEMDEQLVIPDDSRTLAEGAVAAWNKNGPVRAWFNRKLRRFCRLVGVSFNAPVREFPAEARRILLHGTTGADEGKYRGKFEGVIPNITEWWGSTENEGVKEWLGTFLSQRPCTMCHGDRLRIEALHVLLESEHGVDAPSVGSGNVIGRPEGSLKGRATDRALRHLNIAEFSRLTITEAIAFVEGLMLSREQRQIAEPILKEVNNRLRFLLSVGLEYLSLDRKTGTLSGGEAQRIRLATQVGSGLVGACYVLDEPTIGLHQRDNDRLIRTLRHLTDIGNTVLVVEHDEDMIRSADHILDIGPGPGIHGGRVVAQGTVADITSTPASITGDYLAGRRRIDLPRRRRAVAEKNAIVIRGARQNNLKGIDVAVPLGGLVCVTGVSGSGKSTLVNDILLAAARKHLLGSRDRPGEHERITGLNRIDRVIEVDQSPIGRTPRSNPATYTGIFDDIRKVFAQTKEAKIRGYQPGRFSFNVPAARGGGRCEACQGQGLKKIEMHFLPDVYVECELCAGKRYNRETLEVTYRGKNIADVLDMTVEEALGFFENFALIRRFVACLHDVGLDYIKLGQPSTTLSGGEAQRVKLATELGKGGGTKNAPVMEGMAGTAALRAESDREAGEAAEGSTSGRGTSRGRAASACHTLYILDEPTTGLHFEDIRKLVAVFDRLAEGGNTLVVIEHNLDVIKRADWIIDLGPEGGDKGGTMVARGTPEQVARTRGSYTGEYLREVLRGTTGL